VTRVTGYKDPRKFGAKTEWPLSPPVTPHHQRPVMVNPGASRSFVACDSDDYVPHGPGDRADSFDNAGSLHVALAAARPVHSRRHSTCGPGHGSYRPALEYGNDHTGKIARAADPARPDMDEACDGWNSVPACVHQHGVGHGADLRLGS